MKSTSASSQHKFMDCWGKFVWSTMVELLVLIRVSIGRGSSYVNDQSSSKENPFTEFLFKIIVDNHVILT
jgi:hypothetical protein